MKWILLGLMLTTSALACSPTPTRILHGNFSRPSGFERECGIFWQTWKNASGYPGEPFKWAEMWSFDAASASGTDVAFMANSAGYTYIKKENIGDNTVPTYALYYVKGNGHVMVIQMFHALGQDYMVLAGN